MAAQKLGKRIREVREKAGLNQKEFCAELGIPQSTLSAYETDRMQPTVASLINIAEKWGVSLDWLCGIERANKYDNVPDDLNAALTEAEMYLRELEDQRKNDCESINSLRQKLLAAKIRQKFTEKH